MSCRYWGLPPARDESARWSRLYGSFHNNCHGFAPANGDRNIVDAHRDRIALDGTLMQDLDARAFGEAHFQQMPFELVAALGGACNIGLQRHDGSDESARRIAEAQFVCGCFGCSLVDGHAPTLSSSVLTRSRQTHVCY